MLARAIAEIEAKLPTGVRSRQLPVRSFVLGIARCLADGRPAHLVRVHQALCDLEEVDRWRLGVIADWKGVRHELTYRQIEYLASLLDQALNPDEPAGVASVGCSELTDALLEASVPASYKDASSSLAIDWTDFESFARPPTNERVSADPASAWGHRRGGGPGEKSELFFGHYLSLATMVNDEAGGEVPELVRAMTLSSCRTDPVPTFVATLERRTRAGLLIGDVLADSGYAHRVASNFALRLRALGAELIVDLRPADRGPQGTLAGAVLANGNCYCPATPKALFELAPLSRAATPEEMRAHDGRCAELARYKLGRISAYDADGYHRVGCPAVAGKLRCPLRPASMLLGYEHPEVLDPPEHPPVCCKQSTITVPPSVNAKTAQKHDYPSRSWRISYARRSAVERSNSRIKDPASIDIQKGWCRLSGLVGPSLFLAVALVVRNFALVDAFEERQARNARLRQVGLAPRTRRRRRRSVEGLIGANVPP